MTGGTPEENAHITHKILSGEDHGPRRDIVLLNAAAAIYLVNGGWHASVEEAKRAIDSGAALQTLEEWIAKTRSYSDER
jgi:anthranilate phosphoribosyltransferase